MEELRLAISVKNYQKMVAERDARIRGLIRRLEEVTQHDKNTQQLLNIMQSALLEQIRVLRGKLEAAQKDLAKAEEVEQEIEDFLDNEVHPNYPYDLYLNLMDSVRSIVDWEHAEKWKEQ